MPSKICTKCGEEKDHSAFWKHKTTADGLRPDCKDCVNARRRERRRRNQERDEPKVKRTEKYCSDCSTTKPISEFYRDEASPDKHNYICKSCQAKRQKDWRERNREQIRERKREYYEENKEWIKEYVKEWRRENGKGTEYWQKRRAWKLNAPKSDLTDEQWEEVLDAYDHSCAYCSSTEDITQDHLIPLSRGGSHTITNVIPACRSCNARKGDSTALEYLYEAA